jgi:Mg-chelatase subunit ChlD
VSLPCNYSERHGSESPMKKLLTLDKTGRLSFRLANGMQTEVRASRPNVLLLIDTSASMAGAKIEQAKSGAMEFAHSAIARGYSTALAIFADRAAMVCDPTVDATHFTRKIARLDVGLVGETTDLAAGLILADKFRELAAVVIVTDGATAQEPALRAARALKNKNVEIICIGTDDADRMFLKRLATRSSLATHVISQDLRYAISDASHLLRGKQ